MRTNARIYVMRADDGTLKLGHSTDPTRRANEVGRQVEIVHETDVIEHAEKIERLAHRVLALHGKHIKGEWFEASLDAAILAIEVATKQAEGQELVLGAVLGRPDMPRRLGQPERRHAFTIRVSDDFEAKVDRLRKLMTPTPNKSDAVRAAVDMALTSLEKASK